MVQQSVSNSDKGSKLLIFDGHNSHLSSQVVKLALENNTELFCLPAHTSSILQPLHVGVFKIVKGAWRKCLRKYYDETRYSNVDKKAFPGLLKSLIDSGAFSTSNAISAFEACGIYPLNRNKITDDKLATSVPLTHPPEIAVNSGTHNTTECDLPGPSSLSTASPNTTQVISPRKGIEKAILSHLRQITPKSKLSDEKRVRIKRTLAECLTSAEASKRLQENEERKQLGAKKIKNKATPNATAPKVCEQEIHPPTATKPQRLVKRKTPRIRQQKNTEVCLKPKGPLAEPNFVVHKPVWLNTGGQEGWSTTNDPEARLKSTGCVVSEELSFSIGKLL